MTSSNILLQDWDTPFGLPPFQAIRDEDFIPAFEDAMRTHRAEIETIANDGNEPTFANTVEALERAGRALTKVANVFFNLSSADTNDTRQAIERDIGPKLAKHSMAIYTDPKLFGRIDALAAKADTLGLDGEQRRLLERYHKRFIRAGAKLDAAGKARLTEINSRLSELHTAFSQNVLAAEKAFQLVLDGEADLAGLPDFVREGAAMAAEERGLHGKHVITLSRASVEPFLEFSTRRDLREKAYRAYFARGEGGEGASDNTPLIREILALRAELATLLGFSTYAAYQIDDAMAKTPATARDLLEKVWAGAKRRADAEAAALAALAQAEGHNEPLAGWDWHYYAEKQRKAEFDIDGAALKPYFELDAMIAAAFETAHRLFGLSFEERRDLPIYHPDVRAWTVKNRDGKPLALFVGDYFARPSKRSGAWMSDFREQSRIDGEVLPIIVNVLNFTKGGDGKPSLLSLDDVRTLFHEFGHGLHGMLSNVTYPGLSGTSVDRDFVELPSQLYENWALQPEILNRFARHVETGEPLSQAIVDKLHAVRKFNQGFATAEYTASALYDLAIHEVDNVEGIDPIAFEKELRASLGVPDAIALRHRAPHFQHIFAGGGYAAGYYTYLWAEVMEADAFNAFEEAGSVFDPQVAERLHRFVYSSGGTLKPDEAYRAFRGRDPEVGPLLEKRGLAESESATV
ncbi:Peptidyl-dipeptidase Dcp [Rhodomicrobium vannielii ATCC 17100]|uniref:Peptidyl-dipeptidase Dcp n=1 Tax=Rhodomicrobium vannielii (strain ATCC 17100 / DSM 162 / LMG 4299 / NCIMB 10020 / ATH 3.1.1) TaxID=648757 RepID=E3I6S7_RHOVT|nr:M3 family metallopeptidase [Rhodomicrobium vannielii]ADP71795.1 Peptidyl-dipeptidase Dcp [Rhodomicrobium vannielii ATCC 17100]